MPAFTNARIAGRIALIVILMMSIPVFIANLSAEAAEDVPTDLALDAAEESDSGKVSATSGANRFSIWTDETPGNPEIFFKRSLDNGATWQLTVNLSGNPGTSDRPAIAVSGSKVYVAWRQQNTDADVPLSDIFFRRSLDNGATWGPKTKISSEGMVWYSAPTIAASGDNVYIIWNDSIDHPYFCDSRDCTSDGPIFFRKSSNSGQTWGTAKQLGISDTSLYDLVIQGSNLYVIWGKVDENGMFFYSDSTLYFVRSTDGGATWKSPVILQNRENTQECFDTDENCFEHDINHLALAASGANIYALWTRETCGLDTPCEFEVILRRSNDGGATWKAIRNLSNNAGTSRVEDVVASGSNVFALWVDDTPGNDDLFFRKSIDNGVTWQAVKNLSNNAGYSYDADIVVSGSNLYLAWRQQNVAQTSIDILLKRSSDNGATWKPAVNISNMNSGYSSLPQVAVTASNVFVVWQDDTPGNHDTLFRRSIDGGVSWQTIKNLSNNSGPSQAPQVAL